jgi:hypothetical protein
MHPQGVINDSGRIRSWAHLAGAHGMENGLAAPPCKIKPLVIRLYILSWMKLFATIFVERIVLDRKSVV